MKGPVNAVSIWLVSRNQNLLFADWPDGRPPVQVGDGGVILYGEVYRHRVGLGSRVPLPYRTPRGWPAGLVLSRSPGSPLASPYSAASAGAIAIDCARGIGFASKPNPLRAAVKSPPTAFSPIAVLPMAQAPVCTPSECKKGIFLF
jgi:hypothetical protein